MTHLSFLLFNISLLGNFCQTYREMFRSHIVKSHYPSTFQRYMFPNRTGKSFLSILGNISHSNSETYSTLTKNLLIILGNFYQLCWKLIHMGSGKFFYFTLENCSHLQFLLLKTFLFLLENLPIFT